MSTAETQTKKPDDTAPTTGTKFHLSLNVRDLSASTKFFRILLGCEPAKCRSDYAKFELSDPPLVLSLEPYAAPAGGNLNHLGFRVADSAAAVKAVPVDGDLLQLLGSPGFEKPGYAYRATSPCFRLGEAELRETRIEAWKKLSAIAR